MDMLYNKTQSAICVAVLIRDQAREMKNADLKECIESLSVQNNFLVAYGQYQNGPAESSINSIMLLNRTQMVESG